PTLAAGTTTQGLQFTVSNTSANAASSTQFTLAVAQSGVASGCTGAPASVTLAQGTSSIVTLTCAIGASGQSGSASITASATGVTSQTGTSNITMPPWYSVSVTPASSSRTEAARTAVD